MAKNASEEPRPCTDREAIARDNKTNNAAALMTSDSVCTPLCAASGSTAKASASAVSEAGGDRPESTAASVQLTMLGTGNAAVTRCYNTCFALRFGERVLLVDGGGGNGILPRLEAAGIALRDIRAVFLTHTHTDHIFGLVWVLRMVAQAVNAGQQREPLQVYGHAEGLRALETICRLTLPGKVCRQFGAAILFCPLEDGDTFSAAGMQLRAFDIGSTKAKQFGFTLALPGGGALACLGDEPFAERTRPFVEGADWLLCEAFCCYEDRERFHPYEKHHSTAQDAGRLAAGLGVKHLLLYHTEDTDLPHRRERYSREASAFFPGPVLVPDDGETLRL